MADRKEPGEEEEEERREEEEEERRELQEGAERRRRRRERREEESGDDPLKHIRILQRRWQGSPPPTAERYARALRQWRALPGAVMSPGTGTTAASDEGDQP